MDFRKTILAELKARKISIYKFAKETRVPKSTLNEWLNGTTETINSSHLELILEFLKFKIGPP